MSYRLTADIDDMSRNEARAVFLAILEKFGAEMPEKEIAGHKDRLREKAAGQNRFIWAAGTTGDRLE